MGDRGPIGKRDSERVRRNTPENPTETVAMIGTVAVPELGDISCAGETHPLVTDLYESIKNSAAVKYYEPTDWQFARLTLYTLNEELISASALGKTIGAMKLTAINQMLSSLLLTEGERRRVRLEVERQPADQNGGQVIGITDVLKQRLAASAAASGG